MLGVILCRTHAEWSSKRLVHTKRSRDVRGFDRLLEPAQNAQPALVAHHCWMLLWQLGRPALQESTQVKVKAIFDMLHG